MNLIRGTVCSLFILLFSLTALAQETPLSIDELLTALSSTSSGLTIDEKNEFITTRVSERGVDFPASDENLNRLRTAGASPELIETISSNAPSSNQTAITHNETEKTPEATLTRLWVDRNVVRNGRAGMTVHAHFTAYNLKDRPMQMTVRFRGSGGEFLRSTNTSYANRSGQLALYKNLRPGHEAAVYKDWSVFLPYSELPVVAGSYRLEIVADLIKPDGNLFKNLGSISERITKPKPSLRAPKATFNRMWVEYGVREKGQLGMRIHVNMKVSNLKDIRTYLRVGFEKRDGTPLTAKSTLYGDRAGRVSLYSPLKPATMSAQYDDIAVFMPYEQLNLETGSYRLVMRADLIYPDGGLIQRLGKKGFRYSEGD